MVFVYVLQWACILFLALLLLFAQQSPSSSASRQRSEVAQKFIQHYKNELFELTEGCWVLQAGHYDGKQLASNIDIPYKIYTRYDNPPNNFPNIPNIESVLLSLDGQETNSFDGKILMSHGQPRAYTVMIKFTQKINIRDIQSRYICYKYVFSTLNYPPATPVGSNIKHLMDNPMEKTKRDLEFKLFMLTTMANH